MTSLLIRLFVGDSENTGNSLVREAYGKLAGWVGVASNLGLFLMKLLIGAVSGSISIMADAINNLSDCASSIITLIAFKMSGLPADEQHPYGHARIEYISGLVVSFLILAIGVEFLVSSIRKIFEPTEVVFTPAVAVILLVSIGVKLWQGMFNRGVGERIDSTALKATAVDSISDVVATSVVLLGAVISYVLGLQLDGWMGLLVAGFILYSGVRMVIETLNPLLGTAPDCDMVAALEDRIMSYDSVLGIHDLMIHNYGPNRFFASVHVEVPANQDILLSHDIIDNIERDVCEDMGLELVIHMDPIVTNDERLSDFRQYVAEAVAELDPVLTIHDFRMVEGKTHTNMIFDVVVPPRYPMADNQLREAISKRACRLNDNIYCVITIDRSYTSTRGSN